MKTPVDHEGKRVGTDGQKPPVDEEARRKRSAAMKAFHRKTGLGTIMGNRLAKIKRAKPKP